MLVSSQILRYYGEYGRRYDVVELFVGLWIFFHYFLNKTITKRGKFDI